MAHIRTFRTIRDFPRSDAPPDLRSTDPLTFIQPRPRLEPPVLAELARRLTDRDRYLLELLYDHTILTTPQINQIAFNAERIARRRMTVLWDHRAVDRFRPFTALGSAPLHYVLDEAGAVIVSQIRGIPLHDLHFRRDRSLDIATSPTLTHTVGTNGFFTTLLHTARHHPTHHLTTWLSERDCHKVWPNAGLRPDAYGRWKHTPDPGPTTITRTARRNAEREVEFFLEYDRGTEPLTRVAAKLPAYTTFATRHHPIPVLIHLPTPAREQALRPLLTGTTIPVATTHAALTDPRDGRSPADPVWLPTNTTDRIPLIDLPTTPTTKARP